MRESKDKKNSEYKQFLRSVFQSCMLIFCSVSINSAPEHILFVHTTLVIAEHPYLTL